MKSNFGLLVALIIMSVLMYCITGCTPQQRLSKLIRNNPNLIKRDSVLISDSILIKGKHATFYFDTTINNYNSSSNGIDINVSRHNGQYKLEAKTNDTTHIINHFNYYNNYITKHNYTFRDKVKLVLIGIGVISIVILIILLIIKFIK